MAAAITNHSNENLSISNETTFKASLSEEQQLDILADIILHLIENDFLKVLKTKREHDE